MKCENCKMENIPYIKKGFDKHKNQRFKCKKCGYIFTLNKNNHKFERTTINEKKDILFLYHSGFSKKEIIRILKLKCTPQAVTYLLNNKN